MKRTMTPKESTIAIRKALKEELGISNRQVSVRTPHYSSIRVLIKVPNVSLDKVKEIAEAHQKVDYCQYSGEILQGGNTFVSVSYSRPVLLGWRMEYRSLVEEAMKNLEDVDYDQHVKVGGTGVSVSRDSQRTHLLQVWNKEGHITDAYAHDINCCCRVVAEAIGANVAGTA